MKKNKSKSASHKKHHIHKKHKIKIVAVIALIFLVIATLLSYNMIISSKKGVAAEVNGKTITMDELDYRFKIASAQYGSLVNKEIILNQSITEVLILEEAEKLGIGVTVGEVDYLLYTMLEQSNLTLTDFEQRLSLQGLTLDEFREYYKREYVIAKVLNITVLSKVEVSEEEIENYYNAYEEVFKAKEMSLEDAREPIREALVYQKHGAILREYVSELWSKARIKVYYGGSETEQ